MRIVSMFMIVVFHFIVHGHILKNTSGFLHITMNIIMLITVVHVNSFVMVTGYFQSKSTFKMSKFISLNNTGWFWCSVVTIVLTTLGLANLSKVDFILNLMPILHGPYWYLTIYLALYIISPMLNKVIDNINEKQFKKILLVLFLVFSFLPTITGQKSFYNTQGFSLTNFIFLYFIGAYLRQYPIKESYWFKKISKNLSSVIFIFGFLACVFINVLLLVFSKHITGTGEFATYIGRLISSSTVAYDNPLIIFQTIFFFLWFGNLEIKSKVINYIASLTLGIYLIHDHDLVRGILYSKYFGLQEGVGIESYSIVWKMLLYSIIIFIICLILELIRKLLFQFIYNWKISGKIRAKGRNYTKVLEIDINQ